ncbi:MAG: DUF1820 family protein [Xanthomonadales bacterium]|nr:DUF1820 family protein [Xanthomonadales bacterium]NIX11848.1 DUF1820 family protein [Xanthomonadales bacterium]
MAKQQLYRIAFHYHDKVYELFCTEVCSSSIWGFVEVAGLVFEEGDGVVIDPTEEKLRDRFEGVEVLHLPMHNVLRVEQVRKKGQSVIRDRKSGEKVTPFPISPPGKSKG